LPLGVCDHSGGVESMMNQNFERAGYATSAPSAWLNTTRALRIDVPCAPLHDYLGLFQLSRVDIFWLDVEGAELAVIESYAPYASRVSIGILVVEMRFNDARRNLRLLGLLASLGFELVRALPVWNYKINDLVFIRTEHFGVERTGFPRAALALLHAQRRNHPPRANVRYQKGKAGARYVVAPPESLLECAVWRTVNQSSGEVGGVEQSSNGDAQQQELARSEAREGAINNLTKRVVTFVRVENQEASMC